MDDSYLYVVHHAQPEPHHSYLQKWEEPVVVIVDIVILFIAFLESVVYIFQNN